MMASGSVAAWQEMSLGVELSGLRIAHLAQFFKGAVISQDQAAALHRLRLPRDADLSAAFRDSLLGGIVVVQATGHAVAEPSSDLYRTAPPAEAASPLLAVPYYIWCNRGQNPMQVWIRE